MTSKEIFHCTNCETAIEIKNPTVGFAIECPTCFTIQSIKHISPPTFEYVSDNFDLDSEDISEDTGVYKPQSHQLSATQQYLCIPFNGSTKGGDQAPGKTLANQLSQILNEYHDEGWMFLRIDTVRVFMQPGCLASLFGAKVQQLEYDIVIFKR